MANYVLVHGGNVSTDTWNEVTLRNDYPTGEQLGGKIWNDISAALKAKGSNVFTPTLESEFTNNLSDHIEQICELITNRNLSNVILAGHSYGGMIITGVANKIPSRIDCLVYVDAALPEPGESLVDLLTYAGYDPKIIFEGSPKAYIEKIYFNPQILKQLSKVYILCTESEFSSVSKFVKERISNNEESWDYFELPTSHLPMATMPDKITKLLLNLKGDKSSTK